MKSCDNCKHQVNFGDSVEYTYCGVGKVKKTVKRKDVCDKYESEVKE